MPLSHKSPFALSMIPEIPRSISWSIALMVTKTAVDTILQTIVTTDPNIEATSCDGQHIADSETIVWTKDPEVIAVQHRQLVSDKTKPYAACGVSELRDDSALWKIFPATVKSPFAVRIPVHSLTSHG